MKQVGAILVLGVIIALVVGYVVSIMDTKSELVKDDAFPILETEMEIDMPDLLLPDDEAIRPKPPVNQDIPMPTAENLPAPAAGEYLPYSDSVLQQKLAEGKRVVLFFHAAWCPTCRLADESIRESLDRVPPDVAILKVDYDREKDLKDAYAVSYQHTFVQIADDRSPITTFQGASTASAIVANIQ